MKINPINSINFTSTRRTTYQNTGTQKVYTRPYYSDYEDFLSLEKGENKNYYTVLIKNSNYSDFFRSDVDWLKFADELNKEFKDKDKVNVYDFGCSDGSEAYSLIISLIETLGEKEAQKFFPIKASDKDPYIVNRAQKGLINCTKKDFARINEFSSDKFDKYFEIVKEQKNGDKIIRPKDILKSKVIFQKENIQDGIKNVERENSLVLARNFLHYLTEDELKNTLIEMRKLDESSLIVIGRFDEENNMSVSTPPWFFNYAGIGCYKGFLKVNSQRVKEVSDEEIKKSPYVCYDEDDC